MKWFRNELKPDLNEFDKLLEQEQSFAHLVPRKYANIYLKKNENAILRKDAETYILDQVLGKSIRFKRRDVVHIAGNTIVIITTFLLK